MKKINLLTSEKDLKKRLDVFLSEKLDISRNKAQAIIKEKKITVAGKIIAKPAFSLEKENISITAEITKPKKGDSIKPSNIPIEVIFENNDVLVVSKPPNMVVHPAGSHKDGTLVNAVLNFLSSKSLSKMNEGVRPGVVHRLDKDTSGVIIFAKNDNAHLFLAKQFADRKVSKKYVALVHGHLKHKIGTIDSPIARSSSDRQKMAIATDDHRGKRAVTHFIVSKNFPDTTLAEVTLETGRTHQIRVHFSAIGHPLVGDEKYAHSRLNQELEERNKTNIPRIFLHARELSIKLPGEKKARVFSANLPVDLTDFLETIKQYV